MSFPARWPGTCTSCGDDFDEGDEIEYRDGEIVGTSCCGDEPPPRRRGPAATATVSLIQRVAAKRICATCNQEIPLALGRCENC